MENNPPSISRREELEWRGFGWLGTIQQWKWNKPPIFQL
jgi:hypothetical protein